jgi:hypothetical protein
MQGYIDPFAHRRISDREDDDGEEVDEDGAVEEERRTSAFPDHDDRDVVVEPDRVDQLPLDASDDLIGG